MAQPFSLQAPEEIAKEYGGNKSKIAEAAKMGMVDPTAAVLAGMFIDRMRSAAQAEMAPQQTVAEQVLTPPAPAMPPMGGLPPAVPPAMPAPEMPAPEMGMAGGGLAGLYVPDGMFDESTNGGFNDAFAGGGIVAFAAGSPGKPKSNPYFDEIMALREQAMGFLGSPEEDEAEAKARARYEEEASDESYEKQRKQAMWEALTNFGINLMAPQYKEGEGRSGILGDIGKAAAATLPELRASKEEIKERQEKAIDKLMQLGARNREVAKQALEVGTEVWKAGKSAEEFDKRMAFEAQQGRLNRQTQLAASTPKRDENVAYLARQLIADGTAKTESQAIKLAYEYIYGSRRTPAATLPGLTPGAEQETVDLGSM